MFLHAVCILNWHSHVVLLPIFRLVWTENKTFRLVIDILPKIISFESKKMVSHLIIVQFFDLKPLLESSEKIFIWWDTLINSLNSMTVQSDFNFRSLAKVWVFLSSLHIGPNRVTFTCSHRLTQSHWTYRYQLQHVTRISIGAHSPVQFNRTRIVLGSEKTNLHV